MIRKEIKFGTIYYYNEQDQYHREDGPALEWDDGTKFWCINDLYHRLDGPAAEYPDGDNFYFIMGKRYSYEEWLGIKDFPLLW